jgi:hypothetical protein
MHIIKTMIADGHDEALSNFYEKLACFRTSKISAISAFMKQVKRNSSSI